MLHHLAEHDRRDGQDEREPEATTERLRVVRRVLVVPGVRVLAASLVPFGRLVPGVVAVSSVPLGRTHGSVAGVLFVTNRPVRCGRGIIQSAMHINVAGA